MRRILLFLALLLIFAWLVHKSGTIERVELRKSSGVPGAPDRVSVEYRWHWDRFSSYVKGFLPR